MKDDFDVVVIGAGPAGYVAAIRCAQLGMKTACVDDWTDAAGEPSPGGTCLNVGCIPSKALLESSEHYAGLRGGLEGRGIRLQGVELDLDAMMAHKRKVVSELTGGIRQLFGANGVTLVPGRGQLLAERRVRVTRGGESRELEAGQVILAPGSQPVVLPGIPLDGERVVDSSGALAFDAVPQRLAIIGAGVIGLELGSVWRRLGAEQVILLEAQEEFLPMVDTAVAKLAARLFKGQGLDIRLGSRVTACELRGDGVAIHYQDASGEQSLEVDRLVVAVGRRPNTDGLATDEAGLLLDEWGFVHVDEYCASNLPGVWAIGDAVRGPMLAHKGSEEGVMVAERIHGEAARVDYDCIPSVIYTLPEIAWVGQSEQALKAAGQEFRAGVFPFAANGRARAMDATDGFVKILADAVNDRILGVHMIGPACSELIGQAVTAMQLGGSAEDVALGIFAHPSLSEAFHEAALALHGRALHIARPRG